MHIVNRLLHVPTASVYDLYGLVMAGVVASNEYQKPSNPAKQPIWEDLR